MYKIAAVGDKDSVRSFAVLGIEVFPAEDPGEAAHILRRLAGSGYGIIYITEYLASQIPDEIERYASAPMPAITPTPGIYGNTGLGLANVKKFVEKAVGSDILA